MTGSTFFLEFLNLLQLIATVIALVAVFVYLSERNSQINQNAEDIGELKSIVSDLVKAQIAASTNLAGAQRMIDDLSRRIEHLEQNRCTHCGAAAAGGA